jgi:hypothetical protein
MSTMNELVGLGSLGLALPSPAYIVGSILFGIVGYVVFRRGRRASRPELTWAGVALMVYPYAVPETWLLWLIGALLCVWLYAKWD